MSGLGLHDGVPVAMCVLFGGCGIGALGKAGAALGAGTN